MKNGNATDSLVLLPRPRSVVTTGGACKFSGISRILLPDHSGLMKRLGKRLQQEAVALLGLNWGLDVESGHSARGTVVLKLEAGVVQQSQGYRLSLRSHDVCLTAHDPAGLFYGIMTLVQLMRQTDRALPAMEIEDYPDFPVRGVMLDISRDKVPTMETLFALVDKLAEWKINHLQLYTEHTFAYARHREVWKDASPLTVPEIRMLDAYCRERFIELVPNQNSFGHMQRWLIKPDYADLAEAPEGAMTPWGTWAKGPHSLNPADPRSLPLIAGLYDELLPNFTSLQFNVGCDETWDLGQGKCKALCEQRGKGRVYLEFLLKLYHEVTRRGRKMLFWGDIIIKYPELVAEIPKDVVVLEWGYEGDHPFAEHGAKFAASGLPFYVCPGTSSWNSLAGRTENCLLNLENAAANGLKNGAVGFLVTDWGDGGHWQFLPVSYLGFAAGAALSWAGDANRHADWTQVLALQVFRDEAGVMGKAAYDLGNTYLKPGFTAANRSVLFTFLREKLDWAPPDAITEQTLSSTMNWIDEVVGGLPRARMQCHDASLITEEFRLTVRMLQHACNRAMIMKRGKSPDSTCRTALEADMRMILGQYRKLWLARNRTGGLADSTICLEERLKEYTT